MLEFFEREGRTRSLGPKSSLLGDEHVFLANLGAIRCVRFRGDFAKSLGHHQRIVRRHDLHKDGLNHRWVRWVCFHSDGKFQH